MAIYHSVVATVIGYVSLHYNLWLGFSTYA